MESPEYVLEEDFSLSDEDSDEARFSQDSLAPEGTSIWESLPDVCLQHVFKFLSYRDRSMASLVCRHWYRVMRTPCLWRTRLFSLNGRLTQYWLSEYTSVVGYVRSLGVYLEKLQVCVCAPRSNARAQRLRDTICGLLYELVSAKAPLQSLSILHLKLDRTSWSSRQRNTLVDSFMYFLANGGSKLRTVSLKGMRIGMEQGLNILSALSQVQKSLPPHCCISSLDLRQFFSKAASVHLHPVVLHVLQQLLQGVTDLGLSYSCLSDELLMALQQRHSVVRGNFGKNILQKFHCTALEMSLINSSSWANLASSFPELYVKITVEQVIDNDFLARMLVPGIPLREYNMTAFSDPDEYWNLKLVLRDMLPLYRHTLQSLTLDFGNNNEPLDAELLELVTACESLVDLRVWAFLDIITVERLLEIRLTKKPLLNKIKVRIYSMDDNQEEQEEKLEEVLHTYQLCFPPELEFIAKVYPLI